MTTFRILFLVSIAGAALYALFAAATPAGAQSRYIGCFKDAQSRAMTGDHFSDQRMTPQLCIDHCGRKGFAYAGVQWSRHCFCGNAYNRHGPARNCNMKCSGNNQICGGSWANSVFSTGARTGTPAPAPTGGHAYCDRYARNAIAQNQQNLSRRCGFTGPRWQSNYNNHYQACRHAVPAFSSAETSARTHMLSRCRPAAPARYKTRWDKVAGPGGGWTTGWVYNQPAPECGHTRPLCASCPGNSACGNYGNGAVITHAPYGGRGDCRVYWSLRCTAVRQ